MEPRIQYAKTSDGVNIAYYAIGDGPPLVLMPGIPGSHLHMEWQTPAIRGAYELAARRWRVVRYDPRGFGLSDRGTTDFSVEALRRDLGAVADHLSLDRFRLVCTGRYVRCCDCVRGTAPGAGITPGTLAAHGAGQCRTQRA